MPKAVPDLAGRRQPVRPSPEAPAPCPPDRPLATPRDRLSGVRVMVVEDDDDSRDLICALIKMAGATVVCVNSVVQAMDRVYHSFDPDVVLTDFCMPDADGFALIREFRKAPSTRAVPVPILILSGHSELNWHARAIEAGAADVVVKPFDPDVLISRIAAAVANTRGDKPRTLPS
jgi:DNA-binding response OmpR family regulator